MRTQRILLLAGVVLTSLWASVEASAQAQSVALFNGRDLDGWQQVGAGRAVVAADGSITTEGGPGLLYNSRQLRDFVLELEYRGDGPDAESGIFLRLPRIPADVAQAARIGYEVQIRDNAFLPVRAPQQGAQAAAQTAQAPRPDWDRMSGGLTATAVAFRPVAQPGEWNRFRIEVVGQRYQVSLNGVKVVDYMGSRALEGSIALELGGPTSRVHFRNVRLTTLTPASSPQRLADMPALQAPRGAAPIRVLVVTATHDFRHTASIDASKLVLRGLEWANEFRFDISDNSNVISAANLANYDVLMLNNSTLRAAPADPTDTAAVRRHRIQNPAMSISLDQQKAMMDFVRSGKGVMSVHSGIDANYGWAEFREMMGGGLFRGHPWTRPGQINVEDPSNAAVSHFGPSFQIREEMYVLDQNPRPNVRVLLSLDMPSVGEAAGSQDHPMAFVKKHGEGRVFVTVLGHFADNWQRPDFVQHVLQGLRIAAGTVPADFTPHAR